MRKSLACVAVVLVLAGGLVLSVNTVLQVPTASMTADTRSSDLAEGAKVAFLRRYLVLHSEVEAAQFHIRYRDNSGGPVPGPSEWDIRAAMKVPDAQSSRWTAGLRRVESADLAWGYDLLRGMPGWSVRSKPVVYSHGGTVVAVFEVEGVVFKRVEAR